MRGIRCIRTATLVVLATLPTARAEVSVDLVGNGFVNTLIAGATTLEPDPISIWTSLRPVPSAQILNPDGDMRGDGPPHVIFRTGAQASWPVVAWAYKTATAYDVAYAEWDGSAWTATAMLGSGLGDARDPKLFVEPEGTIHVVWWTSDAIPTVFHASRPAGSGTWDPPLQVSDGLVPARRPSVAIIDGVLKVSYERPSETPGQEQDVVVATRGTGGGFTNEVVAVSARTGTLDSFLHVDQDHLWVDWLHADDGFGCSESLAGSWTAPDLEPWDDPSWIGVETVRWRIRGAILNP